MAAITPVRIRVTARQLFAGGLSYIFGEGKNHKYLPISVFWMQIQCVTWPRPKYRAGPGFHQSQTFQAYIPKTVAPKTARKTVRSFEQTRVYQGQPGTIMDTLRTTRNLREVWYAPASVRSLSGTDVPFLCSSCRPSSVTFTNTGPSFFAAGDSTNPLSGHAPNWARMTLTMLTVNLGDKSSK